ncbi:MAG TPA: glycosyltransferase [Solirubrobacterales bacterium]|nr:glycosyltransferase [Solirubrobacterales bacterium]
MAEPPRVLFAIGGLGRGGSERQLMQLIATAHPGRLRATVLTLSTVCDPGHAAQLRELGVELVQLPPAPLPRAARPAVSVPRAFAAVRRVRPDAVYAWLEEASTTVAPAAWALRVPLLVARRSVCGSGAEDLAVYRIPIRLAERQARIVTGNSLAVVAEAEARGVDAGRVRLVPNGHPAVEPLPPREAEPVALGYLANYRPEKGHERFLAALERLDARTPWRADLAGDGEMRAGVEASIAARGLSDRVSALGQVADVRRFWEEHDVAVLLSDDEGSPNVLIEAAMLGRPLVGTDAGGTREVVRPEAGLLVPHDPAAIAAALEQLIEDPELRRRLGEGARRSAVDRYDAARSADAHLAAIEEAIGSG